VVKGLYRNIPVARTRGVEADELLGAPAAVATFEHHADVVAVNYHPRDWPDGPILHRGEHDLTRATMLATKGLARAGIWKRAVGHESELKSVRWEGDAQVGRAPIA